MDVMKYLRWSTIPDAMLQDSRLSWEARGLLAYLLTHPNNAHIDSNDLVMRGPASKGVINRILSELRAAGYLEIKHYRDSDGRLVSESLVKGFADIPAGGREPTLTGGPR